MIWILYNLYNFDWVLLILVSAHSHRSGKQKAIFSPFAAVQATSRHIFASFADHSAHCRLCWAHQNLNNQHVASFRITSRMRLFQVQKWTVVCLPQLCIHIYIYKYIIYIYNINIYTYIYDPLHISRDIIPGDWWVNHFWYLGCTSDLWSSDGVAPIYDSKAVLVGYCSAGYLWFMVHIYLIYIHISNKFIGFFVNQKTRLS